MLGGFLHPPAKLLMKEGAGGELLAYIEVFNPFFFLFSPPRPRCCPRSERGGGAAGVLADEAVAGGRAEERGAGGLRDGALQQPPLRLLRHAAGGQLLRQLPGRVFGGNLPGNGALCAALRSLRVMGLELCRAELYKVVFWGEKTNNDNF